MFDQTYTTTLSRAELSDICYAALQSVGYWRNLQIAAISGDQSINRAGCEANIKCFNELYNKFHAMRCMDEMILPESK